MYGATYKNKKGIFAIRLASNMTLKSVEQWYKMNRAKNYTEFRQALDIKGIINQYITYADKYDTIYCVSNGAMPIRPDGYDWTKTVPGNTMKTWGKANDCDGYFYASEAFFKYKTTNIMVHKDGIPKEMKKKLGIK